MKSSQFDSCEKCGSKVSIMDLDNSGKCFRCRTRAKMSMWQMKEQKRLEKDTIITDDTRCKFCDEPKKNEGYCRKCGK